MECTHPKTSQLQTEDYSIVCRDCGCILEHVFTPEFMCGFDQWKMCPLSIQYARVKRFEILLDNVVLGLENRLDYKVLSWIGKTKKTFKDTYEILLFLKRLPFTDKRYCSIHLLNRVFCKNYNPPPPALISYYFKVKKHILHLFKQVEHHFFSVYCGPFLNYKFILMVLLYTLKLDHFVKYVKPIKSIMRIKYNCKVWNTLKIMHDDKVILIEDTLSATEKWNVQLRDRHV